MAFQGFLMVFDIVFYYFTSLKKKVLYGQKYNFSIF